MARIVSLEDVDPKLRHALGSALRLTDSAVVLPQAHRSVESGAFKNIVMRINGVEPSLSAEVFSSNWFSGVSAVKISKDKAELILSPKHRASLLEKLKKAVPSEMESSEIQVGPGIEGDERDRDKAEWVAGFDSPSCCVGVYSALQSRCPNSAKSGMSRLHRDYYLVCKAGGGVAAQVFHARLSAALKKGATLHECFVEGGEPGAQVAAWRRPRSATEQDPGFGRGGAGSREPRDDRRLLQPARAPYHGGLQVRRATTDQARRERPTPVYQYSAGCVDSKLSHGLMVSSNVSEGFVAFAAADGDSAMRLVNDAHNCVPFATERLENTRTMISAIAKAHKQAIKNREDAHPDKGWISERFAWNCKDHGVELEPPPLWGSHSAETFISEWSRELGVSRSSVIRMQPELVVISAPEPGKLRVAAKSVLAA